MKANIFKKINNSLGKKSIIVIAVLVFLGLSLAAPASADWAITVFGGILKIIISGIGLILILAIRALVYVAQYSTFLDSGAVTFGWVIVRDLCNMFFVIVLLVIAFGTILNIEKYNYKKWLPKLILMAILINFSKTICGIMIDVAQVVMLTFVNSFSSIGAGTLVNVLGITDILQIAKSGDENIGFWTVIGAYLLGLAYVIISLIVVITMISMLAIRIVMIWIYVVLSPLAYLLSAFPGGQSYASKWWTEFTKNLIVGPVLAFFLWLSFAALTADQMRDSVAMDEASRADQQRLLGFDPEESGTIGTKASSPGALIKFVIAIGMLVGGLKIAQEVGGAAGSMAGKGMAAVNKAGKIGLAGAAAITGVRAAKGIYKNYSSARKSAREDKYKNAAVKMADGIGKVKKTVGEGVMKPLQWAKGQTIDRIGGGRDAKRLEAELNVEREQLATSQQNFNQKTGPIIKETRNKKTGKVESKEKYEYDQVDKKWKKQKYDEASKKWADSNENVNEDDIAVAIKAMGEDVSTKQEQVIDLRKSQKSLDDILKVGALAAGGVVAAVMSGGGLAGLALGAGAAVGMSKGYSKLKNAGKTDLGIASGFRLKEIKKEKDALKDEDDGSVIAKMDDRSVSAFERAAAALEAMERGLLSSEQAADKKKMIRDEIGGATENNDFKDKKVGNYVESIAEKKNISGTDDFQNLDNKNEEVKSRAERNIRSNVEKGTYSLESLDLAAIKAIGPQLVALMKAKDFGIQFTAMKDQAKKREIVEMLKKLAAKDTSKLASGSVEKTNAEEAKLNAMKRLNQVTDLNTATASVSDPGERQKYKEAILVKIPPDELRSIFEGTNTAQQEAIQQAYADTEAKRDGDGKMSKLHILSPTSQTYVEGTSPAAKSIKKHITSPKYNKYLDQSSIESGSDEENIKSKGKAKTKTASSSGVEVKGFGK